MCLLGKESILIEFLIATNEIWDISVSFLNEHLEETLGPIEIEGNHSKCINLTQASVSS